MSQLEHILKAALLGTEKWMPPLDGLPGSIGTFITEHAADREDAFLKYAGLYLTYHQAGSEPVDAPKAIEQCPNENHDTLDAKKAEILRECLKTKDELLIGYMADKSNAASLVAPGDTIPDLLDMAVQHKKLSPAIASFAGATGQWLRQFNPHWQGMTVSNPEELSEEVWETGHESERVQFLETVRKQDPQKAIALLEKAFPQENAATRASFLQTLHIHKSIDDEPFLTAQLSDKSKQVKQEALYLLKTIPGTAINTMYLDYCVAVCTITEERTLLFAKKKLIHIAENIEPSKELFSTGINKVSNLKGVADHLSWFAEALAFTSPDALATALGITADKLLDLLLANKSLEPLQFHFTASAINSGHIGWVQKLIAHGVHINSGMLKVLPWQEAIQHLPALFKANSTEAMQLLDAQKYEDLPMPVAQQFFEILKAHPYLIQKPDYRKLALCFPVAALGLVQQFLEKEVATQQNPYFINQAIEIEKILMTKKIFTS